MVRGSSVASSRVSEAMARAELRLEANAAGDFFVDESCIDCDACGRIAPEIFASNGEQSFVARQPRNADEILDAERALIACPTGSIGTATAHELARAIDSFPSPVLDHVRFCGFTSEKSFGAFAWLIVRGRGNVLIDSPRFTLPLANRIREMGGVSRMLLTHIDDIADHQRYHDHFHCARVLHRHDARRNLSMIELQPSGGDPIEIDREILMIPVPGHTRGHAVYLWRDRVLFTGDHLAWKPSEKRLYAFRDACWYSWSEQIRSMKRLLDYSFEWVLPGHGHAVHLDPPVMKRKLEDAIRWMESVE